jgi:hypothetical protein
MHLPMSREELVAACRIPGTDGLRPHATQSLRGWRSAVLSWYRTPQPPCGWGRDGSLIVVALDGISFDVAQAVWSPTLLAPLTSTFPSVSATAWLTSTTGLPVEEHLVAGVVYYLPAAAALVDCYAGEAGEASAAGFSPCTVFDDLSALGVECVACAGEMATWPAWLREAILSGARLAPSRVAWEALRLDPAAMVAAVTLEIESALRARRQDRPLFLWAFVNLDEYIHLHGYDEAVLEALREIERAAARWVGRRHAVMACSDHGLVENQPSPVAAARRDSILASGLCRLPAGGAGRVLWLYARPGREEELFARAADELGDCALVLRSAELQRLGLVGWNDQLRVRLGEVCLLATRGDFPSPQGHASRFEHGSFTAAEMLAVLAAWS